jgi:hypothetical protein
VPRGLELRIAAELERWHSMEDDVHSASTLLA